jgi:uncharacterized protein (DUF1330 family)
MAGFVIGQLKEISNPDAFGVYQGVAIPTVVQYGGKLVMNSKKVEAANGGWSPAAVVVIEFESDEQAPVSGTTLQSIKPWSDSGSTPPTAP